MIYIFQLYTNVEERRRKVYLHINKKKQSIVNKELHKYIHTYIYILYINKSQEQTYIS